MTAFEAQDLSFPKPDGAHLTDELVRSLYRELHSIALREHFRSGAPPTLQATALISEAYIKLQKRAAWESQSHFLGSAATAIRHILIDAARARLAGKRDVKMDSFTRCLDVAANVPDDREIILLDDALRALVLVDPKLAQVIECRFFAGYSEIETANIMEVSDRTVRRWWIQGRAWLYREMAVA